MFVVIIVLILLSVFFVWLSKKIKRLSFPAVNLTTGGVKTGKSSFAISSAIRTYRKRLFIWKFCRIFLGKKVGERPLLYSNIPLSVSYVPITTDILLRRVRPRFGSVFYLGEFSLVADSQYIRDQDVNNQLLAFLKLFGHETHGGILFVDSQSISDCHYALKRVISSVYYIHSVKKFFGILIFKVQEFKYSDDGSILSTDDDLEEKCKLIFRSAKIWKKFDCYCYSSFTDNLPVYDKLVVSSDNLKVSFIPTFKGDFLECDSQKK